MTITQKINMAIAYKGISQATLACAVNMSRSNFNNKLKRGSFSHEELEKIATALGATYHFGFVFNDGIKI